MSERNDRLSLMADRISRSIQRQLRVVSDKQPQVFEEPTYTIVPDEPSDLVGEGVRFVLAATNKRLAEAGCNVAVAYATTNIPGAHRFICTVFERRSPIE